MAGFGPAPKPESQQRRKGRNLATQTTRLPSSGRHGETPTWPLPRLTAREKALWAKVWATPQAIAWERLGWLETVARYVRFFVIAEKPKAPGVVIIEVRQLEDRLGLSPMAMLRLRWEITDVGDDAAPNVVDIRARMTEVGD